MSSYSSGFLGHTSPPPCNKFCSPGQHRLNMFKIKSLGYSLCKYVNQRFVYVVWNSCGTCNCTIVTFSFFFVKAEKHSCTALFGVKLWSVPVVPFFFFEKHWKIVLTYLCWAFFCGYVYSFPKQHFTCIFVNIYFHYYF